ncbi:hypothetical protein ACFSKU_08255 [Pontibacter silvestris]|uniref:CcoQ/FixQ family Cbb3-type cytochrome c oxidase assembly chaperone n=1 Tax=Pontibacter silvestris TaxID=2305183 RepID=A0ABW4WVU3_9BACT|nr:hypothetical protein [Pontibacter silvestris]MCC9137370.1 hypothetical protein [Pontibacter silvestris]
MYKNVLQAIAGIEIYPLISLSIFFLFFVGLLIYVLVIDKKHVEAMSIMPCGQEDGFEAISTGGSK